MEDQPQSCEFDLRSHALTVHVSGPLRTGLEIDFHRFGKDYEAVRLEAVHRLRKDLRSSRGDSAPQVRLPDTAHGEIDDEEGGSQAGATEWSGFGSRPYRPTALLELVQPKADLVISPDALRACADRLGCADSPACQLFPGLALGAHRLCARLHDTGHAVLTIEMTVSGAHTISVEDLRTIFDCAVEAAKREVEQRFEALRPSITNAILGAAKDWHRRHPGARQQRLAYYARDRRKAPQDNLEEARAEGYGFMVAFHRLFEMGYGDGFRDRREAEAASERLLEKSHAAGLQYCRPHPDYAAYLGYLNSVFIFPHDRQEEGRTHRLSPLPVIQFYEFAFAAMQDLDRRLFLEVEDTPRVLQELRTRSRAEREKRYIKAQDDIAELRERARLLEFRVESDVDSLPPAHLAYWYQILQSWRVTELRRGIDEKVAFLEQHYGDIHQRMEADLTRRTNNIILFLTGITALSVLADTLGFAFDTQFAWGPNTRNIVSLVLGSVLLGAAAALYWHRTHRSELSRLARSARREEKAARSEPR